PGLLAGKALVRLGLDEAELDAGMARAELGDGLRHQVRAGRGKRAQAQAASAQAGDRLELRLRLGQARKDLVGVPHQGLARVGKADAARMALDEDRSGLPLERRDLL